MSIDLPLNILGALFLYVHDLCVCVFLCMCAYSFYHQSIDLSNFLSICISNLSSIYLCRNIENFLGNNLSYNFEEISTLGSFPFISSLMPDRPNSL